MMFLKVSVFFPLLVSATQLGRALKARKFTADCAKLDKYDCKLEVTGKCKWDPKEGNCKDTWCGLEQTEYFTKKKICDDCSDVLYASDGEVWEYCMEQVCTPDDDERCFYDKCRINTKSEYNDPVSERCQEKINESITATPDRLI